VVEGTESTAPEDLELISAMVELARAQERVDQLRQQNRVKAIADIIEKIKMYEITPEELGFPKVAVPARGSRKSAGERPVQGTSPVPGAVLSIETTSGDGRSHVKPKYCSPDGKETWSGRGKPPLWMQSLLAAGAKKEDFMVKKQGDRQENKE